ncbi:MAG: polyhydroxyalkanoate depolymerase, partial [Gammaproteobacteria bacterium]|nr:polyhydroxyalkanoate depolymerase [Gammaproteobacteria bacterium]
MLYHAYELAHAMLYPVHQWARIGETVYGETSPLGETLPGRYMGAACSYLKSVTRRLGKPEFDIDATEIDGQLVAVRERVAHGLPFADLLHFERDTRDAGRLDQPKVLIVAPMSGHFSTLLRGTVRAMVPGHDTYITDWRDARLVPLAAGSFGLDDYVDYVMTFIRQLGHGVHVIAVCQPSVPVLAAVALMAERKDPCTPRSLTLMGGPIDPRRNPTVVNEHAHAHDLDWFRSNVLSFVPFPNPGCMRLVYPGFMQLSGFMAMNLDRHVDSFRDYFLNLVAGDEDSVQQHERFYDEYLSVMDLDAEFFLQTVERVFQRFDLANRRFHHRGRLVDLGALRTQALMTIEGEKDDICAVGQTEAAHDLCDNVTADNRWHYVQPGVGHYGVFNGTRWRTEIQPRIADMIRTVEQRRARAARDRAKS